MSIKGYTPMDTEKQLPSYQEALLSKTQHHQQQQQQPQVVHIEQPQSRCQSLRSFTYLFIFFSLVFLVLSLIFKFKAITYINLAVDGGCPYPCIDSCYNDFGQKVSECIQQGCDVCGTVGMQEASRYTLLFIVFLIIGGFFIFIQLLNMCFTYICVDYPRNSNNNNN